MYVCMYVCVCIYVYTDIFICQVNACIECVGCMHVKTYIHVDIHGSVRRKDQQNTRANKRMSRYIDSVRLLTVAVVFTSICTPALGRLSLPSAQ